jgi:peptidyl-prolyl cis-trans isomerase A (cyclophilin A)
MYLAMQFKLPSRIISTAALLIAAVAAPTCATATIVRFQTSSGNIDVRLYNSATPLSVTNFLNYVTSNRYNGTFIHRVPQNPSEQGGGTSNFVVQGGGFLLNNSIWNATGIVTDAPIGNEPKFSNTRGTLSFAKNSLGATSQWFFNIGDNSFLDSQAFTAFGRVLGSGMNVVDTINNLPTINASAAQNAAGEDFDEIPVRNLQQVLDQNDITSNEAVMVNVSVLNLPAGDYDFNGIVNTADYTIWRTSYGSTTNAAADGNGNGIVDAADYVLWRKTKTAGSGAGELGSMGVPEPAMGVLFLSGAIGAAARRRRRR